MKIASSTTLITLATIALALTVVGCKKKMQKETTLNGTGPSRSIAGERRSDPLLGSALPQAGNGSALSETPAATSPVDPSQGLKQANGNFDDWDQNTSEFKDQTVYFDYDKANVKPSEVDKLKEVARRMKSSFRGNALRIEGHCDERGTEEYNRTLGDKRAQAIREFLATEGIDPGIMPTITMGEDKPVDPGHNEAAYSKNRRGALVLLTERSHSTVTSATGLGESKAP